MLSFYKLHRWDKEKEKRTMAFDEKRKHSKHRMDMAMYGLPLRFLFYPNGMVLVTHKPTQQNYTIRPELWDWIVANGVWARNPEATQSDESPNYIDANYG